MAFSSEELISFSHVVEGKRTDVEMALDLVEDNDLGYVQPPGNFPIFKKTNTLSVVADRVAIPDSAGLVDPIQHLPPERAAVLKDLHQLKLPEEQWAEVPVVSHQVAASEESKLVRRLLKANMIDIIPEADLPRTKKGKILMGGLFGVRMKLRIGLFLIDVRRTALWIVCSGLRYHLVCVLQGCCWRVTSM